MATVSAVSKSAAFWHTKGVWSARDDRIPSAVFLGVLWVGMIVGFGVDFPLYLHANPAPPKVVHLHAVVFSMWMLILTAQVLLVLGNRVSVHRKLGWFAASWACVMAFFGPLAAFAWHAKNLGLPSGDPPFLSVQLLNMVGFLSLLGLGIALRRNSATHRRMMILSTVALADPGFSRFSGWYWPNEPKSLLVWFLWVFYGNVLLVAMMLGWDFFKKRLIRSFVIASASLLALEWVESWLYFYPPWQHISIAWVQAWARLHILV